ncbi:hypothetical protein LSH36_11g07000 [Paralvinella palmiformis]|uniref:Sine oculis-binding protein-like protein n=1 Tax=Paralvinella palmiformis TaxID=53620 RepID=A0AAD9KDZ2_9ANNE|nr:hypothetical protein LSH36_11g07000 [Paralvinella palmiformis]
MTFNPKFGCETRFDIKLVSVTSTHLIDAANLTDLFPNRDVESVYRRKISAKDISYPEKCFNERKTFPSRSYSRDEVERLNTSSDGSMADSNGAAPCEPVQSLTCAWCQKRAGEKPLSFEMDDGVMKVFCTDLCFTLCRRASFKKNKVCDWCKKVKNTVSYVDFQDGEQQLQFCGEQCLNQYKMNIFCKETQNIKSQLGSVIVPPPSDGTKQIIITPDLWTEQQQKQQQQQQQRLDDKNKQNDSTISCASRSTGEAENMRSYREEKDSCKRPGHSHRSKPRGDFNAQSEKRLADGQLAYKNGSKLRYDVTINGDSDRFPTQRSFCNIPSLDKTSKSPKRESTVYSSAACHRPSSKSSESHSVKGISSKIPNLERLKLNHSTDTFAYTPYSLTTTSPSSEQSAATRSTASTAPPGGPPLTSTSGLGGSQLLGCLGPAGLQPWMYNPLLTSGVAGFPGFGLPGLAQAGALPLRQPGSSLSMATPSPAPPPPPTLPVMMPAPTSSCHNPGCQEKRDPECGQPTVGQGGSLPPPRAPFSVPLQPNPSTLFGMLPPPPGMPGLLGMNGPGLVPPVANLNGLLPPNTLMVPYPVLVPLPIPLPLPIPIPVPCDKAGNPMLPIQRTDAESPLIVNTQIKQESTDMEPSLYPENMPNQTSTPFRIGSDPERTSCVNTGVDRILCACCNRKPTESRHHESLQSDSPSLLRSRHSPSHYSRSCAATSCQNVQNDAIDLSKDRKQTNTADGIPSSMTDYDVNRNNTTSTLAMSPPSSSSSESDGSNQLTLAGINVRHPVESVYSARRSLILDAPSLPKERHRQSPQLDKRVYVPGLNKEHTYGKRRFYVLGSIRPRSKTPQGDRVTTEKKLHHRAIHGLGTPGAASFNTATSSSIGRCHQDSDVIDMVTSLSCGGRWYHFAAVYRPALTMQSAGHGAENERYLIRQNTT